MFLSIFELFKIGIGPSSSHTMGPMTAAGRFLASLAEQVPAASIASITRVQASLYGSLSYTGRGHASDKAVVLGLAGFDPATLDPEQAAREHQRALTEHRLNVPVIGELEFDAVRDIVFEQGPALEAHPNGLRLIAWDQAGESVFEKTYYSIGGGFVVDEQEFKESQSGHDAEAAPDNCPWPFQSATEMLQMGRDSGLRIAEMKRANELATLSETQLQQGIDDLLDAMHGCVDRGLSADGILPGGLSVKRRAHDIHEQLIKESGHNTVQPHVHNDWLSVYAMAVNEENAGGGRVVTAPTNGAAGVVPAVLRYYQDHCLGATADGQHEFLLVAAAIGGLIKHNASISGAEVGCQGEVGSAAAMAAAGLCAVLGGSNEQVENAAEIALEHHLGMTCDPAGGLVQVPCIERNALGAIKAVSAASLALRGDGTHFMPLDNCIETMRQTGADMNDRYKETSLGGIAVNFPAC